MVVLPSPPAAQPAHRWGARRSGWIQALVVVAAGLADALNHAFGNPREEAAHQPPMVGVQPYRDQPRRRSR